MNEFVASLLALPLALLLAAVIFRWGRERARRRQLHLRDQGYRLIHELKAYSAWIDFLRGEPPLTSRPEELTSAESLRNARAIAQVWFPALSHPMLRLLQGDSHLMRHLWQQKLLRLSAPGEWTPYQRDPDYRHIREAQDDLVEEIIARCQVLIGERGGPWRSTDMDSSFFATSMGASTSPCR